MGQEFYWEGHHIVIHSEPALKYLWAATETVVKVDDVEIGRAGGFRFTERLGGNFPHKNNSSKLALEMKTDLITLASIPFKLEIDGNIIAQGRLRIDDWILIFVPLAILITGMCFFAVLVRFLG
jgi:hypothetical protein